MWLMRMWLMRMWLMRMSNEDVANEDVMGRAGRAGQVSIHRNAIVLKRLGLH